MLTTIKKFFKSQPPKRSDVSLVATVNRSWLPTDRRPPRGRVAVIGSQLHVALDNYYSVRTLKESFGQFNFLAVDYLPPGDGLPMDYAAVKEFIITSWVIESEH